MASPHLAWGFPVRAWGLPLVSPSALPPSGCPPPSFPLELPAPPPWASLLRRGSAAQHQADQERAFPHSLYGRALQLEAHRFAVGSPFSRGSLSCSLISRLQLQLWPLATLFSTCWACHPRYVSLVVPGWSCYLTFAQPYSASLPTRSAQDFPAGHHVFIFLFRAYSGARDQAENTCSVNEANCNPSWSNHCCRIAQYSSETSPLPSACFIA